MTRLGIKKELNAHLWERHPDDWYVEPEWNAERLFEIERFPSHDGRTMPIIWDPSCGMGRIVDAALRAGYEAYGSDIAARWEDTRARMFRVAPFCRVQDFFTAELVFEPDWVISNAPFKHCHMRYPSDPPPPYVVRALEVAKVGACILLPLSWIAGDRRVSWLREAGLYKVLVITPRPSMPPGPVILAGENPGRGEKDFAWFIFKKGHTGDWTGGWCDRDPGSAGPPIDPETQDLVTAVAALEG